jgi:hypothetical protein
MKLKMQCVLWSTEDLIKRNQNKIDMVIVNILKKIVKFKEDFVFKYRLLVKRYRRITKNQKIFVFFTVLNLFLWYELGFVVPKMPATYF